MSDERRVRVRDCKDIDDIARLTADLAERTDELAASKAIERDLLAVTLDFKARLAARTAERDAARTAERDVARRACETLIHEHSERQKERDAAKAKLHCEAMAHMVTMQERDDLAALLDFVIPEGFDNDIVDMRRAHDVLSDLKARAKAEGLREAAYLVESLRRTINRNDGWAGIANAVSDLAVKIRDMAAQVEEATVKE